MRFFYRLKRVVAALPYDAWGIGREKDVLAREIRRFINTRRWQRFPPIVRPFMKLGLRALWLFWCPCRVFLFLRAQGRPLAFRPWSHAVWQGMLYGRRPAQVFSPELPLPGMECLDVGQLRVNHWLMFWEVLGDKSSRALAQDKLELSKRLAAKGLPVPEVLAECPRGLVVNLNDLPWPAQDVLFIKPRHGSRAEGACSVKREAADRYLINGDYLSNGPALRDRLTRFAQRDSLLVQPFLRPMAALADLSPQSPPELRITTARSPDGESHICSCYMKVQPPGDHAATVLSGALAVPIEPDTGLMEYGLRLEEPSRRYSVIPWNGAYVAGRTIPGYTRIKQLVVAASRELPGLPFIGWDVLLTAEGPVILEANSGLSWRLIHLRHALSGEGSQLPDLLSVWLERAR